MSRCVNRKQMSTWCLAGGGVPIRREGFTEVINHDRQVEWCDDNCKNGRDHVLACRYLAVHDLKG